MSAVPQACIVLAGGLGTRLKSAVPDRPKCLAPVGTRPFLEIQLQALAAQGFGRFVLSLGHMAALVQEAVRGFRVQADIECIVEAAPLGTGGAVAFAMREAQLAEAAVVNGDTFIEADLAAMRAPLRTAEGERFRMATVAVADRARFGGVALAGDTVTAFVEKGQAGPGLINAGLYRLHASVFEGFAPGTAFSMETQVMPALLPARGLRAAVLAGEFIDIGVPEDYHRFCARHG